MIPLISPLSRLEHDHFVYLFRNSGLRVWRSRFIPHCACDKPLPLILLGYIFKVLLNDPAADIARHDDDGILKIDDPSLVVGKAAIIEHLQ